MRRILVVDDEEKIRAIIRKYGEFEGYDITEAKDGMEAVKLCREQDFDVIILDIMMPELDWLSTCQGDPQDQKHSGDHAVGTRRRV